MFGIIYKITNNINEKIYIGQTTQSLRKRFQSKNKYFKMQKTSFCKKDEQGKSNENTINNNQKILC